MLVKRAYKYKLRPSAEQAALIDLTLNNARFVYNHYLGEAVAAYEAWKLDPTLPKPQVSHYSWCLELTQLKQLPEKIWLNDCSNIALQQKLMDLSIAYQNFFKHGRGYPKFKSRFHRGSFRLTSNGFDVVDSKLRIARCSTLIEVAWSRELPCAASQITISKEPTGEYFVSFLCEVDRVAPINPPTKVVGLDLGVPTLVATSGGVKIDNPRPYVHSQDRLAKLQRALSRKQKGSKNRTKARIKLAKCHAHIANQRRDYSHKFTSELVRDHGTIVIEDLAVSNMLKNHKLAKHIACAAWRSIRTQLEYKCIWSQWSNVVIADRWEPSTQMCSECGLRPYVKVEQGVKSWVCPHCGAAHDRDRNASLNLRAIAYRPTVAAELKLSKGKIIPALRWSPTEGLATTH